MERALLEQRLAEAERHVLEGERLVQRQRATIEERRHAGLEVELATDLLAMMEDTLGLHIADRDRLRRELASDAKH